MSNHLLLGAGDAASRTLISVITHNTYFSLAWPSEGAPPDLLLYMFVPGCSGLVSAVIRAVCVVTRVSPASDGEDPVWVTPV